MAKPMTQEQFDKKWGKILRPQAAEAASGLYAQTFPGQYGPKTPQRGKGGTATSLISEGATLAGTLAAVGAAPFTGGASLAALPLIAGGSAFAGRLAENKIRDNRWGVGDAAKEGLLSGALSAIPGGKAATGAGKLSKAGTSLRAFQRGTVPGVQDASGRALSKAGAAAENAALDSANKWFKGVGKSGQWANAQAKIEALKAAYSKTPEAASKIAKGEVSEILKRIQGNIYADQSLRGNLKGSQTLLKNIRSDISKMSGKSRSEFLEFVTKTNQRARAIVEKGQVGSKDVQVWNAVRDALKSHIDEAPGFADKAGLNKQLSTLISASGRVSKRLTSDVATGGRSGLTLGRVLENVAGPSLDVMGRGLQQAGRVTGSTLGKQATRQFGGRAVAGGFISSPPEDPTLQEPGIDPAQLGLPEDPMTDSMGLGEPAPQMTLVGALQQAQQLLGPDATAPQYLSYAKAIMDSQPGSGSDGGLNVTKPTSEKYAQAVSGMDALNRLESLIQGDPGVLGRSRTPGRGLNVLGIGSAIKDATGTAEFDTLAFNAVDNMLRIATGAAAPESEIRRYMNSYVPAPSDSPQAAKAKLDAMRRQFASILGLAQQKARGNYLEDAIISNQGQF